MNDIRHLISIASRRLSTTDFFEKAHLVAIGVAALALVLMLVDRITSEAFVPWAMVAPALLVAGLLIAGAWWVGRRRDELHVAVLVDERLDLREKLSTALLVADQDDPFARAAVEDAVAAARDPRNAELARRRFSVEPPRGWYVSPLILVGALLLSFVQPLDLFSGETEVTPEVKQATLEVATELDAIVQEIEQQPELKEALSDLLGELTEEGTDPEAMRSPEQVRRNAIKRITDLNQRLEDIVSGEKGKTAQALEKAMRQLESPEEGPAKELADALASADFSQAKKALEKIMSDLEKGELSQEQREQLAEQLQDLAAQLDKLAQQQKQLEDALKQAGMDPQLAQNQQALQQALENNQNLNDQQRQQLQQMAQAQQAAQQMCQGLSGACQAMAQSMSDQGMAGDAAGQMGDQLSEMEQLQMLMQQAQAAANACQGSCQGLGQGLGQDAWAAAMGQGMGQGQGGGLRQVAPSPTRTKIQHAPSKTGEGDIIARMLVEGPQVVGESEVTPSEVMAKVVEGIEKGLTEDQVPRRYHEAQKHFFGEFEKRVREQQDGAAAEETTNSESQDG